MQGNILLYLNLNALYNRLQDWTTTESQFFLSTTYSLTTTTQPLGYTLH
jgi:hypothetical protein